MPIMEDKLVTLAIHTNEKAQILKHVLEGENIEVHINDVDLDNPGPFLDVSYDHFLALDDSSEPGEGWETFAQKCYAQIEQSVKHLPSKFCSMYMYMKKEDWLYNYRHRWLIERSFERLKNRANYLDDDAPVFADFEKHYKDIQESYKLFFPQLKAYVEDISGGDM